MKRILILFAFALLGIAVSCSKSAEPPPPVNPPPNQTGTSTGTGTKPDTTVTVVQETINTNGGYENIDAATGQTTRTYASNADGQGVQTAYGGDVEVELTNVKDGDFTLDNTKGDIVKVAFTTAADPIMVFKVSKTEIVNVHINKIPNTTGYFTLVATAQYFDTSKAYTAADIMAMSKTITQVVQIKQL